MPCRTVYMIVSFGSAAQRVLGHLLSTPFAALH
jgi:hypothetical protein